MTAPRMTILGFPFSLSRSAKALQTGLWSMAVMAGKKSILRMWALPALVMGVRFLLLVPVSKIEGVTPAWAASCRAFE